MAFRFLSQLNQNAGYEVEDDEDRSSPVDEEEGENEESDIELDPEDTGARGNGNRANANLDLDSDSETEEGANAEPGNEFAWSSELHDVEIEMFTQYTGPLFFLNMSDSMQTKYNTQKSTRKPKNDQKTCIMQAKNVFFFFARNIDFLKLFFSNVSYKKYESCYIWFESVSNSLSK